ncbi:hypothetical protein N8Z47_06085 [Salibacteraceae bacterium]|nr:hypothetical protein [Salibacteraceae bacterium]
MIENLYSLAFQIIVFFIISILINLFINWRVKKISQIVDEATNAQIILKIGLFLGLALVISELGEVVTSLKSSLAVSFNAEVYYLEFLKYLSLFSTIGLVLFFINYFFSLFLFNVISGGKNLFIEICNDNWIISLLYCGIFISMTLLIQSEMAAIIDHLIPYPPMKGFN